MGYMTLVRHASRQVDCWIQVGAKADESTQEAVVA
jgi:hypothetical protein